MFGKIHGLRVKWDLSIPRIYNQNLINVTTLIKKETFMQLGGYREDLPGYEDWDLWIRLAAKGSTF